MNITRTFDLLDLYRTKYSDKEIALASKVNGKWVKYSSLDYITNVNLVSIGLLSMGFSKGDKIAVITNNRPEFNFMDMGMAQIGVVHVPIYPTISKDDYFYILNDCKPKLIIVSDKALYEKIFPITSETGISTIYTFNQIANTTHWSVILEEGQKNFDELSSELEKRKNEITPGDLFTLIYTSGTTGFPKGVMLSHQNLVSNFIATSYAHNNGREAKALSFLPLSHIYERMINYHYQYKGLSIYYAENMGTIGENLREIKPEMFCAVPRIFELFFERIIGKGHDLPLISRKIFFWAVKLASKYDFNENGSLFYRLQHKIADKLVYKKWREALGGKLTAVVSGGASLQKRLSKSFWAAGVPIIEGYGLSETSPVIAVSNITEPAIIHGSVGPVLPGVTLKIADDGEILCKGPNVMLGYYNQPQLTTEVIDSEGWFHTGDIGKIEKDRFLIITDRKKEIFKLSSGKYIAPQVIENKLKESEFIENAMVIGENEKFASAIVQPNFPYLHSWCAHQKMHFHNNSDLIAKKRIVEQYQKVINEINKELGQTEQIKRFRLISDEWTASSGELSPTLKLKRKVIMEKYKDLTDQIYLNKDE